MPLTRNPGNGAAATVGLTGVQLRPRRKAQRRGSRSERRRFAGCYAGVLVLLIAAGCGDDNSTVPDATFDLDTLSVGAEGFPPMPIPATNPVTREGVALGRRLFYDPIFSGDSTLACGSCHASEFAFSDHNRRFSAGIDGRVGTRNAPSLTNVGWEPFPSWDARIRSIEGMVLGTIPLEIGMQSSWDLAVSRLERHRDYPQLFVKAFGNDAITPDRAAKAIAQFVRTIVSHDSKYDRFQSGEETLTPSEARGYELFFTEKGDCFHCHVPPLFSDLSFHDIGLDEEVTDIGLGAVTMYPPDRGKFKTPTLRNLVWTAPYMHDGRFETLEEVLDHYNAGGSRSPNVDPLIRVGIGLGLTEQEKQDIIAFLKTLTDSSLVHNPELSSPFN